MADGGKTPGPETARRPHLDGVRGLAIALVVIAHVLGFTGAGLVGVLVFFVLSGYLITGLLLREHERRGTLDLRQFYVRRGLRLLPALTVFLALFVLASLVVEVGLTGAEVLRGVVMGLTYTTDFALGLKLDYTPPLAHLWTLAVEEHFYLIWPLALMLMLRRGRLAVAPLVIIALAGAVLRSLTVAIAPVYPLYLYALPTTWIDPLMCGVLLAVHRHQTQGAPGPAPAHLRIAPVLALAALFAAALHPGTYVMAATYLIGIPALAMVTAWLIWSLEDSPASLFSRAFSLPALRYAGAISYALYLYNSASILIIGDLWEESLLARAAGLLVAVLLAVASYHWVEIPALRLKARLGAPRGETHEGVAPAVAPEGVG
jgi:peptidoglycan/LPS O-acetylase OafA/YrhL